VRPRRQGLALLCGPSTSPLVAMAQIIALFTEVALVGVMVAYAVFVLRRFGPIGPWPGGWRLALLYLAALLGVGAFIAAMIGAGAFGGFIYCSAQFSLTDVWPCSLAGRLAYGIGSLGLGLPLFALWMRFAKRTVTKGAPP
jgi:hypothetical protein